MFEGCRPKPGVMSGRYILSWFEVEVLGCVHLIETTVGATQEGKHSFNFMPLLCSFQPLISFVFW